MTLNEICSDLEGRIKYLSENESNRDIYELHIFFKMITEVVSFYNKFFALDIFEVFVSLIQAQKNTPDILTIAALELRHRGELEAAAMLLDRAGELDRTVPYIRALAADVLRELGKCEEARTRCNELLLEFPRLVDVDSCLTMCDVNDLMACKYDYYQLLDYAHRMLKPKSYIEIGVSTGKSLALARSGTSAVGVDPNAANTANHFFHSPEVDPQLFPMTSNDFFRNVTISSLFGVPTFDMAFIDGLHVFEQALMDFVNLENLSTKNSVVFIHDCLPVTTLTAERERQTGFWTGDVWRVVACLKAVRPDLEIVTFPASPSGLAMVTNLDSTSRLLAQQFDSIVAHFITMPLPESFAERCELLNVTRNSHMEYIGKWISSRPSVN